MRFATVLLLLVPACASGAPINWGSAFELVTDADIDLSFGHVVYALNGGDNTGNEDLMLSPQPAVRTVMIGGTAIDFEGIEAVYGPDASFGMMNSPFETFGDAIDHLPGDGSNVTFSTTNHRSVAIPQVSFDLGAADTNVDTIADTRRYKVGTGNPDLDVILASQVFFDGRVIGSSALNIELNNLTPGQDYQIQLIGPAADSPRISAATVDDGLGNAVPNLHGFLDLDGDNVFHVTSVIGNFRADSTSQRINVVLATDRNSGISGLILTTNVPEPSTALLALAAAMAFLAVRRLS